MLANLNKFFKRCTRQTNRCAASFTITEVIVASSLLILAVTPILKAMTTAHLNTVIIERKTTSLILAQAEMDRIKATSVYNYAASYAQTAAVLDGRYLCNVTDAAVTADLRRITLEVGYDSDAANTLSSDEVHVTLDTYIARRW